MDQLDAMSVLLAVVKTGRFPAASRRLDAPFISELETHLKTRLFIGSSREMNLSDAGRFCVEACSQILETPPPPDPDRIASA